MKWGGTTDGTTAQLGPTDLFGTTRVLVVLATTWRLGAWEVLSIECQSLRLHSATIMWQYIVQSQAKQVRVLDLTGSWWDAVMTSDLSKSLYLLSGLLRQLRGRSPMK